MRLNPASDEDSAEYIVNTYDFQHLTDIFTKISQEKLGKPIALEIIRQRQSKPIKTASRLADIVRSVYQKYHFHPAIDPATKVFLALRVTVNHEFTNIISALESSFKL